MVKGSLGSRMAPLVEALEAPLRRGSGFGVKGREGEKAMLYWLSRA